MGWMPKSNLLANPEKRNVYMYTKAAPIVKWPRRKKQIFRQKIDDKA
jgi:hypothetical protein